MAAKKPTLKDSVESLMRRGETSEFIASKLDVSLQKVLSIAAGLPVKNYTIYEANRSNVEHVMFLESKAFNEILDWNRPIYYVDNNFLLQERSGQWYGFRFTEILNRIGLNFGKVGQTFMSKCLPMLLRQGLTSHSDRSLVKAMQPMADFQHINRTWNSVKNVYVYLEKRGDLSENLSEPSRALKEHIAELLSDDMKETPFSGFVDECLSLWLKNNSDRITQFRQGRYKEDLWVNSWLKASQEPAKIPGHIEFDKEDPDIQAAILEFCSPFDSKVIHFMVDNQEFNSADVNLALNGKIKAVDITFAKAGGFTTAKQVSAAKKLDCKTLDELKAVQKYSWASGAELREAAKSLGLEPHEHDLYVLMIEVNSQINWVGSMTSELVNWVRNHDESTMHRLVGFESPRSLTFFEEVLLVKEENAVRTDYLLEDYNKIPAPGEAYNESTFETFLRSQPFMNVVKVGDGGVSMISRKKQEAARKKHFSQS